MKKLSPSFREKVWGSTELSPWFPDPAEKTGEVWFEVNSPAFPILTKFIFTTDKLSVQVHPNDEYAARHENSRGKTEMWYILRAGPGARIALGLRETLSRQRLREASQTGEIMDLLNWVDARPGDCFFTPAGTIHAIGANLALVEIQQQSDVTYRLYDYGRPRELHLDRGVEVSDTSAFRPAQFPEGYLAHCPYFVTEALEVSAPQRYQLPCGREHLLVAIEGQGCANGHGFAAGEVLHIPSGAEAMALEPYGPLRLLRTYLP